MTTFSTRPGHSVTDEGVTTDKGKMSASRRYVLFAYLAFMLLTTSGCQILFPFHWYNGNLKLLRSEKNQGVSLTCPRWSADGSKIYYLRNGALWSVNADNSDAIRLFDGSYRCLAISANGSHAALVPWDSALIVVLALIGSNTDTLRPPANGQNGDNYHLIRSPTSRTA